MLCQVYINFLAALLLKTSGGGGESWCHTDPSFLFFSATFAASSFYPSLHTRTRAPVKDDEHNIPSSSPLFLLQGDTMWVSFWLIEKWCISFTSFQIILRFGPVPWEQTGLTSGSEFRKQYQLEIIRIQISREKTFSC